MWHEVIEGLKHIFTLQKEIEKMGASLDTLTVAVQHNTEATKAAVAALSNVTSAGDVVTPQQVAGVVAAMNENTAALQNAVAGLTPPTP